MISIFPKRDCGYSAIINNFSDRYTQAKIDVGASSTVLSVSTALGVSVKQSEFDKCRKVLEDATVVKRKFTSATNNEIIGYLTYKENVRFPGFTVPKLFYYIIVSTGNKFLIGLDILDMCDFQYNKYGDFVITDFDYLSQQRDIIAITYRLLPYYQLIETDFYKDYKPVDFSDPERFDELFDEWLEEIYND